MQNLNSSSVATQAPVSRDNSLFPSRRCLLPRRTLPEEPSSYEHRNGVVVVVDGRHIDRINTEQLGQTGTPVNLDALSSWMGHCGAQKCFYVQGEASTVIESTIRSLGWSLRTARVPYPDSRGAGEMGVIDTFQAVLSQSILLNLDEVVYVGAAMEHIELLRETLRREFKLTIAARRDLLSDEHRGLQGHPLCRIVGLRHIGVAL